MDDENNCQNVDNEQGGFRKGKECADHISALKMMVKKYLERVGSCFLLTWRPRRATTGLIKRVYGIRRSVYMDVSASVYAMGSHVKSFGVVLVWV